LGAINTIRELEQNATVLDGFTINEKTWKMSVTIIAEWISKLAYE